MVRGVVAFHHDVDVQTPDAKGVDRGADGSRVGTLGPCDRLVVYVDGGAGPIDFRRKRTLAIHRRRNNAVLHREDDLQQPRGACHF
jgi:hypothetical protein